MAATARSRTSIPLMGSIRPTKRTIFRPLRDSSRRAALGSTGRNTSGSKPQGTTWVASDSAPYRCISCSRSWGLAATMSWARSTVARSVVIRSSASGTPERTSRCTSPSVWKLATKGASERPARSAAEGPESQ